MRTLRESILSKDYDGLRYPSFEGSSEILALLRSLKFQKKYDGDIIKLKSISGKNQAKNCLRIVEILDNLAKRCGKTRTKCMFEIYREPGKKIRPTFIVERVKKPSPKIWDDDEDDNTDPDTITYWDSEFIEFELFIDSPRELFIKKANFQRRYPIEKKDTNAWRSNGDYRSAGAHKYSYLPEEVFELFQIWIDFEA